MTGSRSLKEIACQACINHLVRWVEKEEQSGTFVCGGTIPIALAHETSPLTSPLVRIYWESDKNIHKVILPLNSDTGSSEFQQLIDDCCPATFGLGQKDVLDPSYRKVGKLDAGQFLTSFNLGNFDILEEIGQHMLPSISEDEWQNRLPFRKITAEISKMNIYSAPSGNFRNHMDTPQSQQHIGSLVVCLPVRLEGGDLLVRHRNRAVDLEWSTESVTTIQLAAFYGDCEYEIMTVTNGHMVTLTYNLYVSETIGISIACPDTPVVEPNSLPLYGFIVELFRQEEFLRDGGEIGLYLSHIYPHTTDYENELLPRALKGSDLILFEVLTSLGVEVSVRRVLDIIEMGYYDPPFSDIDNDDHDGLLVGKQFNKLRIEVNNTCSPVLEYIKVYWPFRRDARNIHWLNKSRNYETALSVIFRGTFEDRLESGCSSVAIIAKIPPWSQRLRPNKAKDTKDMEARRHYDTTQNLC